MASSCCDVCVETFKLNGGPLKQVPCSTCDFKICVRCFEQYQTDKSGLYEVSCMNCKSPWDSDHLHEHVPAAVVKRLTVHTKKRLREEETSFMPETQLYVEYDRAIETQKVAEYTRLAREYGALQTEILEMEIAKERPKNNHVSHQKNALWNLKSKLSDFRLRVAYWRKERRMCSAFIDIVPETLRAKLFPNQEASTAPSKPAVLCPCPQEACRGFVTRREYTCGVCEHKVCGKCHVSLGSEDTEPHACSEADIQTAALILKTSKPCPNCAARIHKIEGCDQMWCTHCNTPFSWCTGEKIRGSAIHNPHFYDWIRQNPNTAIAAATTGGANNNNCDGLPEMVYVNRHTHLVFKKDRDFVRFVMEVHRECSHLLHVTLRRNTGERNGEELFRENLDLRFKWLQNRLTDKAFEMNLHRRYKAKLVLQRTDQVYDLIVTLCSDVFHRLLRENADTHEIRQAFRQEFQEIFEYANTCFDKLAKVYKVKMPNARVTNY